MKDTVMRILKKLPSPRHLYTRVRSIQRMRSLQADVRKLFVNHECYLRALKQKGLGTIVLETHDGLSITIRQNIWDARIIKEIFIEKPYTRSFELPPNPVIVDIGGYIGDFSLYAVKYLNAACVVVYEPTPENFAILKQNIDNNAFGDRIVAVNKAVSNSTEVILNVEIQESDEVHVSAYFYPDAERRIIPSVTLPDILKEHHLDTVDLLKVDCEGGEYEIFSTVADEIFDRIQNIVFEYHRVDGFEEKLQLVLTRLESAGYAVRVGEEHDQLVYASRM
jgi:FkbM family methyltransferase